MYYQFTVELRVDFDDKEKLELLRKIVLSDARHMLSNAGILNDKVKPTISVYGDDFFHGQIEINLFDDLIGDGKKELAKSGAAEGDTEISADLLSAL